MFDLESLAIVDQDSIAADPTGIVPIRRGGACSTADRRSKCATAIDAKYRQVGGVIDRLGGRTEHLVSDGPGSVVLNMPDPHTVLKFDSLALKYWTQGRSRV